MCQEATEPSVASVGDCGGGLFARSETVMRLREPAMPGRTPTGDQSMNT